MNIYSNTSFHNLNEDKKIILTEFKIKKDEKLYTTEYGLIKNNILYFGKFAPFWMPNFILKKNPDHQLFIDYILSMLKKKYENLFINLAPEFYSHHLNELNKFFINNLKIYDQQTVQYLNIHEFDDMEDYLKKLSISSRQNVKFFFNKLKLKIINLDNIEDIKSCYNIINKNRLSKNRCMQYSQNYFVNFSKVFKNKLHLLTLTHEGKSIAAAICHVTSNKIINIANWGDSSHHFKKSVNYFFFFKILEYFKNLDFEIIDFGISESTRNNNQGLVQFKKNVLCKRVTKNIYVYR